MSMAQKHAAQLGALPGCAEPRYFPVLMKPSLAEGEARPCRLLRSRPGNSPVHGRAQTFVSKTFRRRPGLNLFFCSISPASETGVTVFLSAALCIHLVCLDPDPPGALEIRSGSSSRPCVSRGPAGAAAITAHSRRIRIRHHPMRTTRALGGTAGKREPAGAAAAPGTVIRCLFSSQVGSGLKRETICPPAPLGSSAAGGSQPESSRNEASSWCR